MLHNEPGENILSQCVLPFLVSLIASHFHCIDHLQPHFTVSLWPSCWPNQSGNISGGTHIPLLWASRIFHAIVSLYIRFDVSLPVVFVLIWIIQVNIPVKPIFSVQNAFRGTVFIPLSWITVESVYLAVIYFLSSSSREVICRQSWWQRWSFWQFKCSCTIMLKVWLGWFDNLFSIGNVSYGCDLLVLSERFLLCSTQVLAALPHLQKVMVLDHLLQILFLCLWFHLQVIFSFRHIQCCIIACLYLVIDCTKLPHYDYFLKGLAYGFRLPPVNNALRNRRTTFDSDSSQYAGDISEATSPISA